MVRKSLRITLENKKLNLPILISRIVIYGIFFLLLLLFTKEIINKIIEISFDNIREFFDNLRLVVFDFFSKGIETITINETITTQHIENFKTSFVDMLNAFFEVRGLIVVLFLIYFGLREVSNFFLGMIDYTVGKCIDSHMESLKHLNFFTVLLDNFKQAVWYGLYRFVMTFIYNFITTAFGIFLAYILLEPLKLFVLPVVVLYVVLAISLRQALVGQVLPYMIKEKVSAFRAFGRCFKELPKNKFFNIFVTYFTLDLIIYAICVVMTYVTFGIGLIVEIPIFTMLLTTIKFVDYYSRHQLKYFNSYDDIVVPKSQRQNDENLLNKVDI